MTSDAVETAAQLIHQRHRAGTANVCGECREVARQVAEVLAAEPVHEWACPGCGTTTRARMADDPAELERLRGIAQRADEAQTWCGLPGMHRAVEYIRTGVTTP